MHVKKEKRKQLEGVRYLRDRNSGLQADLGLPDSVLRLGSGMDMHSSLIPFRVGFEDNHDAGDLCVFRETSPQGGACLMVNLAMLVGAEVSLGLSMKGRAS